LTDARRFARDVEAALRHMWTAPKDAPPPPAADAIDHDRRGQELYFRGRHAEAIAEYRRALELKPNNPAILINLGTALQHAGWREEAIVCFRQAIALRPDLPEAYNNLGSTLLAADRHDDAIACFKQALAAQPGFVDAHVNLGLAYWGVGRPDEAVENYEKAMPGPQDLAVASRRLLALHYQPRHDAQSLLREHRLWNEQFARPFIKAPRPHDRDRSASRRLRVGYVSPHLYGHVLGRNLYHLLSGHDHERFEIFCYSHTHHPDEMTYQLRQKADVWRDIMGMDDDAAAELIRSDGIDILVDLALHSGFNRLLIFARKPAPVQVTYLGYAGTTGLETMDYRLSDPYIDPPDVDLSCYAERTVRLEGSYWCYRPGGPMPEVQPSPAHSSGHVTYGCLCSISKVSDSALDAWSGILSRTAGSRLLLHCPDNSARQRVLARLGGQGVSVDRVEFVPHQSWHEYARTYQRIDVALDPFPFGGGITTCDSLWMGVPVVSLIGRTAVGRGGNSILHNIGLGHLAAAALEDYQRIACDWERLIELRPTLRQRIADSAMTDAARFARDVEAAYQRMWTGTP
jgi:predicted O-linked N-acetylglucosamine transferase (SPINDLY family)